MIKRHTFHLKKIKSQLPRRESERRWVEHTFANLQPTFWSVIAIFSLQRNHALSKHADILTCIETRISMLSMTYTKYIDMNLCCFIPGKIIDEVVCILKLVDTTNRPLRAHEVLQELRDISSMAIDHFDEKIAPILKKSFCDLSTQKFGSNFYQSTCKFVLCLLCFLYFFTFQSCSPQWIMWCRTSVPIFIRFEHSNRMIRLLGAKILRRIIWLSCEWIENTTAC